MMNVYCSALCFDLDSPPDKTAEYETQPRFCLGWSFEGLHSSTSYYRALGFLPYFMESMTQCLFIDSSTLYLCGVYRSGASLHLPSETAHTEFKNHAQNFFESVRSISYSQKLLAITLFRYLVSWIPWLIPWWSCLCLQRTTSLR